MTLKSLLAITLLSVAATSANAMNVYKPGSFGDGVYELISPYLPDDMTAIVFDQADPNPLLHDIDQKAFAASGISGDAINHVLDRAEGEVGKNEYRTAYAINGRGIPGNDPRVWFCAIVLVKKDAIDWEDALAHEAMHCRNSQIRDTDAFDSYLKPIWLKEAKNLSWYQFSSSVDEAMAGGLQVSFAAKAGQEKAPSYVSVFANAKNNPYNSIGSRTAKALIELCMKKDACPTDSEGMLHLIMENVELRSAFLKDVQEINETNPKA